MQVMFVEMHPMSARVARHGKSEYHMKKMKYEFKMHHLQKPVESPTDTCFIRLRIQSCREKKKRKENKFQRIQKDKKIYTESETKTYPLKNVRLQSRLQHRKKGMANRT